MAADPKLIAEVSDKFSRLESFDPFMPRDTSTYGFAAGVPDVQAIKQLFHPLKADAVERFSSSFARGISERLDAVLTLLNRAKDFRPEKFENPNKEHKDILKAINLATEQALSESFDVTARSFNRLT